MVTIDWGDGTPTTAGWVVFMGDDGMGQATFRIKGGPHTYTAPIDMDPYTVSVTVTAAFGGEVFGTVEANVAMPTVSATFATTLIPVNANNDNGSPWKYEDDPDLFLPYIPLTRDFGATNLPVDDPQLVQMTVTIGGGAAGMLDIFPIYRETGRKDFDPIRERRRIYNLPGVLRPSEKK